MENETNFTWYALDVMNTAGKEIIIQTSDGGGEMRMWTLNIRAKILGNRVKLKNTVKNVVTKMIILGNGLTEAMLINEPAIIEGGTHTNAGILKCTEVGHVKSILSIKDLFDDEEEEEFVEMEEDYGEFHMGNVAFSELTCTDTDTKTVCDCPNLRMLSSHILLSVRCS